MHRVFAGGVNCAVASTSLLFAMACGRLERPGDRHDAPADSAFIALPDTTGRRIARDSAFLHPRRWFEGLDSLAANPLPGPVAEWVARFDGIRELTAGMSVEEARRAFGLNLEGEDPGEGCAYAFLTDGPAGVSFMVEGGRVVRVDVDSSLIATDRGVRVGDSEASVRQKYGEHIEVRSHPYSGPEWHYLEVRSPRDTAFAIIFETDGWRVRSFRVGLWAQVQYVEGCS
jgi:hypothetical protein